MVSICPAPFLAEASESVIQTRKYLPVLRTPAWLPGWFDRWGCICCWSPGATLIAPAGVLLTRVLFNKRNRNRFFAVPRMRE